MIDAEERALLLETVRGAIADACAKPDAARAVDAVLAQIGWLELLGAEPGAALEIVFPALGAANAPGSALDDVLASALGATPCAELAVLLPRFGGWDPPGRIESGQLLAHGLASSRAAGARELLVVCTSDGALSSALVPLATAERSPVRGIDPELGLQLVRVRTAASGVTRLGAAVWDGALSLGRRALAHQLAGACRSMLALARGHALEREQFGQPIARFQAVRHRLAEALVAIEALEAVVAAADEHGDAVTAALAKASAGRTARSVSGHCQQVLAGIGFTTDHAFHRYLKRSMALDGLLGSADEIAAQLGRGLLASRRVPTLIEL
jgi:hypothetical protein